MGCVGGETAGAAACDDVEGGAGRADGGQDGLQAGHAVGDGGGAFVGTLHVLPLATVALDADEPQVGLGGDGAGDLGGLSRVVDAGAPEAGVYIDQHLDGGGGCGGQFGHAVDVVDDDPEIGERGGQMSRTLS